MKEIDCNGIAIYTIKKLFKLFSIKNSYLKMTWYRVPYRNKERERRRGKRRDYFFYGRASFRINELNLSLLLWFDIVGIKRWIYISVILLATIDTIDLSNNVHSTKSYTQTRRPSFLSKWNFSIEFIIVIRAQCKFINSLSTTRHMVHYYSCNML